jgi:flagellar biosynthesis protein FlhF
VLSLAISHELPVAYLTDGPRIPMICICRASSVGQRAVSVQMQEPSEEAMADMFADIYHSRRAGWDEVK